MSLIQKLSLGLIILRLDKKDWGKMNLLTWMIVMSLRLNRSVEVEENPHKEELGWDDLRVNPDENNEIRAKYKNVEKSHQIFGNDVPENVVELPTNANQHVKDVVDKYDDSIKENHTNEEVEI